MSRIRSRVLFLVLFVIVCGRVGQGQASTPKQNVIKKTPLSSATSYVASRALLRAQSPLLAGVQLTAKQNAALDVLDSTYTSRIRAIIGPGIPSAEAMQRARMLYAEYAQKSRDVLTPDQRAILTKNTTALSRPGNLDLHRLPKPRTGALR